jgi:multisubunit Na+/H+ antiporter MnhG subunit
MNPVEYAWLIPIAMLLILLFSKRDTWMLPAVVPLITLGDISQRIADVVRSIVIQVFEIATPIVNIVAIAQIIIGLLLWFGARQEFLGWRLLAAGILMLIFMNVVAPMLMQFI